MCMVSGCFLTILSRARCCFLPTEPLLQAQSCCRARLQQQTLPFPPLDPHFLPKRDYARSCANWTQVAAVCVHTEAKRGTKQNNKQQKKRLPHFSWILETLPLTQRWPAEAVRVHVSILQSSAKTNNSLLLSDSSAKDRMCQLTPFISELKGTPCAVHGDEIKPAN